MSGTGKVGGRSSAHIALPQSVSTESTDEVCAPKTENPQESTDKEVMYLDAQRSAHDDLSQALGEADDVCHGAGDVARGAPRDVPVLTVGQMLNGRRAEASEQDESFTLKAQISASRRDVPSDPRVHGSGSRDRPMYMMYAESGQRTSSVEASGATQASREPLSPTIKAFIERFADPSADYGLMVNDAAVRSDLGRCFYMSAHGGRIDEIGLALDDVNAFRQELSETLEARNDDNAPSASQIENIVETAVGELEEMYVAAVQQDIVDLVETQCDSAMQMLKILDKSASTRRAVLGQIAYKCKTPAQAVLALESLGVNASDAEEIAGILLEHAGTKEGVMTLMAGRTGPYDETQRAFDTAETLLDESLSQTRRNIQQFKLDAGTQSFKYGSPLHSPKYGLARAEVMRKHGIGGRDGGNKTAVLERHTSRRAASKEMDDWLILAMNTSFALVPGGGVGVMSKVASGAALSMAGNAPGLLVSGLNKDTAHAAMMTGSGSKAQARNASRSHDIAKAAALTQLVVGGALAAKGASAVVKPTDEVVWMPFRQGIGDYAKDVAPGVLFDGGVNIEAKAVDGLLQE